MEFNEYKDLKLSKVTLGGASLSEDGRGYGFGSLNNITSEKLIRASLDRGINIIDTAPIYGFGESEKKIGLALGSSRHNVHIISKCGVRWHENMRVDMTNDPKLCIEQLEDSLRRLKTDYIDIYMIHWPDKKKDILETLEALEVEKRKGKIRFLGLCNTNNNDLEKACSEFQIDFLQSEANLFNNSFSELNTSGDIFKMSWGTFDKGI